MMIKVRIITLSLCVVAVLFSFNSLRAMPSDNTDGRIKTFLYDENDVFEIITKYGYQSNIEFGKGEKILTLSLGDPAAFKVTPAKNRIFLKTLQDNRHTNMTVITNFRTYLFDLTSKMKKNQNVMYVARFFFPEEELGNADDLEITNVEINSVDNIIGKMAMGKGLLNKGGVNTSNVDLPSSNDGGYNFNYSLSGPEEFAPLKIFDDGKSTFFKFSSQQGVIPEFLSISNDGIMSPMNSRVDGEYIVISSVLGKIALRSGSDIICVFNENIL